jgi:hypothetical protein
VQLLVTIADLEERADVRMRQAALRVPTQSDRVARDRAPPSRKDFDRDGAAEPRVARRETSPIPPAPMRSRMWYARCVPFEAIIRMRNGHLHMWHYGDFFNSPMAL